MNVLFITLLDFNSIEEPGIYTDLMREFVKAGHKVSIVSPVEKRNRQKTRVINNGNCRILKLRIGNIQKTNILKKGIATLLLEQQFVNAIKRYYSDVRFDLILYSTPPITLQKAVAFVKKRDNAKTYLLLKDIFPQNAVDMGMLSKTGLTGLLYRYFRRKEKKLYAQADYIGCMSQANVEYVLKNNPEIPRDIVEVCPNSIEPMIIQKDILVRRKIREKYGIPLDKVVCIFGGNLGRPQGIDFLIDCIKANSDNERVFFLIVGSGTEFKKIKAFFDREKPGNAKLLRQLDKSDYEALSNSCDIGLIFLSSKFTIPNIPSRILSYMQASMPILAAIDKSTDLGKMLEESKSGLWCENGDIEGFSERLRLLQSGNSITEMGTNARKYLEEHYTSKHSYRIITSRFK